MKALIAAIFFAATGITLAADQKPTPPSQEQSHSRDRDRHDMNETLCTTV